MQRRNFLKSVAVGSVGFTSLAQADMNSEKWKDFYVLKGSLDSPVNDREVRSLAEDVVNDSGVSTQSSGSSRNKIVPKPGKRKNVSRVGYAVGVSSSGTTQWFEGLVRDDIRGKAKGRNKQSSDSSSVSTNSDSAKTPTERSHEAMEQFVAERSGMSVRNCSTNHLNSFDALDGWGCSPENGGMTVIEGVEIGTDGGAKKEVDGKGRVVNREELHDEYTDTATDYDQWFAVLSDVQYYPSAIENDGWLLDVATQRHGWGDGTYEDPETDDNEEALTYQPQKETFNQGNVDASIQAGPKSANIGLSFSGSSSDDLSVSESYDQDAVEWTYNWNDNYYTDKNLGFASVANFDSYASPGQDKVLRTQADFRVGKGLSEMDGAFYDTTTITAEIEYTKE